MKPRYNAMSQAQLVFYAVLPLVVSTATLFLTHIHNVINETPPLVASYRFYRTLYVLASGGVLAASGCTLQASLRNPLVDHYVLGIGSGALFATYLSILIYGYDPAIASAVATCGGLLALALAVAIAEKVSGSEVAYILSGISTATLFSGLSLFTYYYVVARYPYAGLLLVGSFVHSRPRLTAFLAIPVSLVSFGYVHLSKRLNTLVLGDEYASQLGVNPRTTRLLASIVAGASSSIIVGLFGTIGFIGLMAPHIARFLLKTGDNRIVVPVASCTGMMLLYAADSFSRLVTAPVWGEVPAGSVVSLVGAPLFLILLVSRLAGRRL